MTVKIDIISGFLGAGKTTLINRILEDIIPGNEKIALIENEFGELGIDGFLLKKYNIEIRELSNGCICCTIFGDFVTAINELIASKSLDRIIVELSGVATLSGIIKALQNVEHKEKIKINTLINVVDCLTYKQYSDMFGEFYKDQIQNADIVILSRTQLADSYTIEETLQDISKLNGRARIIAASWDNFKAGELLIGIEKGAESIPENAEMDLPPNQPADRSLQAWSKSSLMEYTKEDFLAKLKQLNDQYKYGQIIRAKGMFKTEDKKWFHFDYVFGEIKFNSLEAVEQSKITVIGKNIHKYELNNLFA